MNCRCCFAIVGLAALSTSLAFAQNPPDKKPASKPPAAQAPKTPAAPPAAGDQKPQLPPGWTDADMQACIEAGTPGEQQAQLAKGCGLWHGKETMWMAPETPPIKSECTATITPMMDGRYIKCEMAGDMPGMGPFNGFGIYGYDNVAKKYQATWIDNMSTGQMNGTGELSSDGKVMTWTYTYNCPIAKKAVTMREVQTTTGKDTKTLEMYGTDPKSGKEFKMMEIALTRQPGSDATATGSMR